MEGCIFCKIVNGDISSYTIYEDELVKAFFDITPANDGHALVIPKIHRDNIFDIQDKELERIILVSKKIALRYKEVLGMENCNLVQSTGILANQDVLHFHMHVVPRKENDGLNIWSGKKPKKPDFEALLKKVKF